MLNSLTKCRISRSWDLHSFWLGLLKGMNCEFKVEPWQHRGLKHAVCVCVCEPVQAGKVSLSLIFNLAWDPWGPSILEELLAEQQWSSVCAWCVCLPPLLPPSELWMVHRLGLSGKMKQSIRMLQLLKGSVSAGFMLMLNSQENRVLVGYTGREGSSSPPPQSLRLCWCDLIKCHSVNHFLSLQMMFSGSLWSLKWQTVCRICTAALPLYSSSQSHECALVYVQTDKHHRNMWNPSIVGVGLSPLSQFPSCL